MPEASVLNCPSCSSSMTKRVLKDELDGEYVIDICVNCTGIWLDGLELGKILKTANAEPEKREPQACMDISQGSKKLNCPRCSVIMRINEMDGICVDSCGTCDGIWLINTEIYQLLAFSVNHSVYGEEHNRVDISVTDICHVFNILTNLYY